MPMQRCIAFIRPKPCRSLRQHFPGTTADGEVDREKLAKRVLKDPAAIKKLEGIVHPLVRAAEDISLPKQKRKIPKSLFWIFLCYLRRVVTGAATPSWSYLRPKTSSAPVFSSVLA